MAGAGLRHVLLPGPWHHLDLSANGVRLHAAVGEHLDPTRDLVVLLHGFAQHWWAWRHLIGPLDAAGYAVAALDLRGCGGSDQTPRGYDAESTADDVSGAMRALGFSAAVVVAHAAGARAAWAATAYASAQVRALAIVSAPHPSDRAHRLRPFRGCTLPVYPERKISAADAAWVADYLGGLTDDELAPYRAALRAWPGPRGHLGPLRSAPLQPRPTDIPVLLVRGTEDRRVSADALAGNRTYARGPVDTVELPGVGHLLPEEAPDALGSSVLDWLRRVPAPHG